MLINSLNERFVVKHLCNKERKKTSSCYQSGNSISLQKSVLAVFVHGTVTVRSSYLSSRYTCDGALTQLHVLDTSCNFALPERTNKRKDHMTIIKFPLKIKKIEETTNCV